MRSIVVPGLFGGIIAFVLLVISDVIFYRTNPVPPGIRQFENQGLQLLVFFVLAIVHAIIISAFYAVFQGGLVMNASLKGLLFGFFCGLVLARPNVEGLLLFKSDFVPRLFTTYWTLEFLIGYSILGLLIGTFHSAFAK